MSETLLPGFGGQLKAAREARELSAADVAAKLKLSARQVEALEAEDLSHLPGEVFLRGFVRNYARLVEVDAEQLIAPIDAQATVSETITAPSAGVAFTSTPMHRWVLLPLLGLALFLLLVALLYHWLRQGEDSLLSDQTAPPAVVAPQPEATPPAVPLAAPPPQGDGQTAMPPQADAGLSPAPATPNVQPDPASLPVTQAAAPAEAGIPPAGDRHVLRFEADHDAWIQVVDGKGRRYSKLVRAGGVDSFAGDPPFRLVVGEAARVRMSYNGHVIDLTPFIGQKVARLTLE